MYSARREEVMLSRAPILVGSMRGTTDGRTTMSDTYSPSRMPRKIRDVEDPCWDLRFEELEKHFLRSQQR